MNGDKFHTVAFETTVCSLWKDTKHVSECHPECVYIIYNENLKIMDMAPSQNPSIPLEDENLCPESSTS